MFTCDQCGQDVPIHAVLDSEDWEAIADGAYCLCPFCIDKRPAERGMRVECDLQFSVAALYSTFIGRNGRAGAWRPREYIEREGAGLPALFRKA